MVFTALPGGLLLTPTNIVLVCTLLALLMVPMTARGRLRSLLSTTAAIAIASVPASSLLLWWWGGGVDDLAALLRGPAVYVSSVVALVAFATATIWLRRARHRHTRAE